MNSAKLNTVGTTGEPLESIGWIAFCNGTRVTTILRTILALPSSGINARFVDNELHYTNLDYSDDLASYIIMIEKITAGWKVSHVRLSSKANFSLECWFT